MSVIRSGPRPPMEAASAVSTSAAELGPPISLGSRSTPTEPGYDLSDRFEGRVTPATPDRGGTLRGSPTEEVPSWDLPETIDVELPQSPPPSIGGVADQLDGLVGRLTGAERDAYPLELYAAGSYSTGELDTLAAEIGLRRDDGLQGGLRYALRSDGEAQLSLRVSIPTDLLTGARGRALDQAEDRQLKAMTDRLSTLDAGLRAGLADPRLSPAERQRVVKATFAQAISTITAAGIGVDNVRPGAPSDRLEARFEAAVRASGLVETLADADPSVSSEVVVDALFAQLREAGDNAP